MTTDLLRVQHAMEVTCTLQCFKELVTALEWSENESVLAEILKWIQEAAKLEDVEVTILF